MGGRQVVHSDSGYVLNPLFCLTVTVGQRPWRGVCDLLSVILVDSYFGLMFRCNLGPVYLAWFSRYDRRTQARTTDRRSTSCSVRCPAGTGSRILDTSVGFRS